MSLLSVRDLSVIFDIQPRNAWPWTPHHKLYAVTDASFELAAGETLGIVGESGSGKSTLARAIAGTVPVASGEIIFDGKDLAAMSPTERRKHRRDVQMIFQDPLAALNPRMTVGQIVAEPLTTHEPNLDKAEVRRRAGEMMERVGLLPKLLNRYPHEFSGGQCQRIGIARALIVKPRLILCDEPVSALDVSVQAQVVNLLRDIQTDMDLSILFIAHDLSVVKHISDRIFVMYLGRQMETGSSADIVRAPHHPYSQALLASVPVPDPSKKAAHARIPLEGELPSPLAPPSGCVFRTRCPKAQEVCAGERPPMEEVSTGHLSACYFNERMDFHRDAAE
ncbi:ABC transporter ATP-binding protein [Aestuariibius sp. 2305UL40-4]|uniref:ABC transporter ATP-binding protein n=1 Tax=Aestuariibius violaceus TaxID=3234132 RepID=UPI00345E0788